MKNIIDNIFDYAVLNKSFDKRNIVERADNVCVFGLGKYFDDAFERQNIKEKFNVTVLCDNNVEKLENIKNNKKFKDFKVVTPNELKNMGRVAVIIMLGDPRSAIDQLSEVVGKINCITYNDLMLDYTMNGNRDPKEFDKNRNSAKEVYEILDDESRTVYINILANRIAPEFSEYSYEQLCIKPQYFCDINGKRFVGENESLVDCGAYTGDTIDSFLNVCDNKFDSIYAFEMDKENYNELVKNCSNLYEKKISERIHCYNYGVWHENKEINYGKQSSADSYSIFNARETEKAKVVKVDFLNDKKITLIKMDIEGAELNALKGCENIIKKQAPKLAICVYHRIDDLWKIPLYIKSLDERYNIAIRHHADFWVSETVCYAYI